MAVKIDVNEKCPKCGEIVARIAGDRVWFGGHNCPKIKSVGPPSYRRDKALSDVNFIKDNESLEEDLIERDKRIVELEDALRGAAADLSQVGRRFHDLLLIAKGDK